MKYRDLEVGKRYRWKKSTGSQIGRAARSGFAALSLDHRAVRKEWRESPDDSIVTLETKKWYSLLARTAAGEIVNVKPNHLDELNDSL